MSKKPLNTKAVYDAAREDPAFFGGYSPRQQVQYWELINNLEQVLQDSLDQGVMMESVLVARVRILKYAVESNFSRQFAGRAPDERGWSSKQMIKKAMDDRIWKELAEYESALEDPVAYRKSEGYEFERTYFSGNHRFHLDEGTVRVPYIAKTLTIRQFLELQPRALLKL